MINLIGKESKVLLILVSFIFLISGVQAFNFENITSTANQDFNFGGTIVVVNGVNVSNVSLNDLLDVSVQSPSDGEVLTYNSTSGFWENLIQSAVKWIVSSSNGYLYNNSNTLFFNDTRIHDFYFNKTDITDSYYNKTDLLIRNEGTISYNRTVSGNDVTMSAIDYGINW